MRRTLLGMSQEKLGEAIGLTFQQVQKYERGSNRISAGTLYRLGQVLDVPVSFFFDCYDDPNGSTRSARGEESAVNPDSQISRREARLLRLWRSAPSHVSDELLSLLSSLSPTLRDPPDGSGEDPQDSGGGDDQEHPAEGNGLKAQGTTETSARAKVRHARSDVQRVKPLNDGDSKPRRRHGAVWDPTDIVRASKISPRD